MKFWLFGFFWFCVFVPGAASQDAMEKHPVPVEKDEWAEDSEGRRVKTIFNKSVPGGAYGLFAVAPSKVQDEKATFLHFRGGWMLRQEFGFGLDFVGLASALDAPGETGDVDTLMELFGLSIEYTPKPVDPVHLNFVVAVGEGRIRYDDKTQDKTARKDYFRFITPELNLETNLTEYARFLVGVSYRFVTGVGISGLENEDLEQLSLQIGIKLGQY